MGDTHAENLERVTARIGAIVIEYCRKHRRFHADDLREYVIRKAGVAAPGSADRILRFLRQHKVLDYKCLSRRESLYEVLRVPEEATKNGAGGGTA